MEILVFAFARILLGDLRYHWFISRNLYRSDAQVNDLFLRHTLAASREYLEEC